MSFNRALSHLSKFSMEDRVREFDVSSATVELAAEALGTKPEHIAKSLTFQYKDTGVMVVCAGHKRVSNHKFRREFGEKADMLSPKEVEEKTGYSIGGVCPFDTPEEFPVYLDMSLKEFEDVYPACGSANSAVRLSPDELFEVSEAIGWVDICI